MTSHLVDNGFKPVAKEPSWKSTDQEVVMGKKLKDLSRPAREIANVLNFALRSSKDPMMRYRAIWFTVSFAISGTFIILGAGYAFAGSRAALTPNIFKYVAIFPGHLHTHGFILLILALANFWSVAALTQIYTKTAYSVGRVSGVLMLFYSAWTALGFFLGMAIGHQHYNAGVWWYVMVTVLSGAKVSLPPQFKGQASKVSPSKEGERA